MSKRPGSVTVIAVLFLVMGIIGIAYHVSEVKTLNPFPSDLIWVALVRLLAIVSGVFMLRGDNWARWLLVIWMAYHVVLSAFHSPIQVVVHGMLLALIVYFLFRKPASIYFHRPKAKSAEVNHASLKR